MCHFGKAIIIFVYIIFSSYILCAEQSAESIKDIYGKKEESKKAEVVEEREKQKLIELELDPELFSFEFNGQRGGHFLSESAVCKFEMGSTSFFIWSRDFQKNDWVNCFEL